MDIKKNQQKAIDFFAKAPMKKTFDMNLSYNESNQAIFTMPFNEKFCHSLGSLHGGVLATLLDNAGWFTAQPYYDKWINTVDLQVQLLLPSSEKSLKATGSILKIGKKIAFTRMEARNEDDIVVASATATFSITEKSF